MLVGYGTSSPGQAARSSSPVEFDCLEVAAVVGEDGEPDGTQGRQIMDERDTQGHWGLSYTSGQLLQAAL